MNKPEGADVVNALDDIAYETDNKTSWTILGAASDEQITDYLLKSPALAPVIIRRLIERAYLNEQ